ncbi:MAG: hypothetical protein VYE59_01710 [Candidatus Thermoplasmatota archaeon]|nr:hypothetical protein [Candidatus Thermoplasmatota archaeon]
MEPINHLSPRLRIKENIEFELDNIGVSESLKIELVKEIPSRWEKLGNMILLPESSFNSLNWQKIIIDHSEKIWKIFCEEFKVTKIGRQRKIKTGPMRKSQVELLYGTDGIVLHKENGILFEFDTTKVMFSSGNVSERIRVSKFDCSNEIILDLYAGIGYYTLPLLVHTDVKLLHACEINPDSFKELKKNLIHNKVSEKCIIHEGDNQLTVPKLDVFGKINRVMLGLLPSSEMSWELAINSLDPKGGILHLHGNASAKKEKEWADKVINKLEIISDTNNRNFKFELLHIEKVKSYAPKVNHVVLDIRVFK